MTELKAGDRVERTGRDYLRDGYKVYIGQRGTVKSVISNAYSVMFDKHNKSLLCLSGYLKKIEEPKMKYERLKAITGETVRPYITSCKEMRAEFEHFVRKCGFIGEHDFDAIIGIAKAREGWIDFLLEYGFIKKIKPETFYVCGDKLEYNGSYYIVARLPANKVVLVNLETGCPRAPARDVKDMTKITRKELEGMKATNNDKFKPVKLSITEQCPF